MINSIITSILCVLKLFCLVGSGKAVDQFVQSTVHHRIGLTLYKIDAVMDGGIDEIIDALATADQAEKLKNAQY